MLRVFLFITFTILFCSFSLSSDDLIRANPTRPTASDNAFITAYGHVEIEFGWAYSVDRWFFPTLLKFTPFRKIEVGLNIPEFLNYAPGEGKLNIGGIGLQLKTQLVKMQWGALAVVGRFEFPFKFTFYGVASLNLKSLNIDITLGESIMRGDENYNETQYAISISPDIFERTSVFMEIYGFNVKNSNSVYFDAGFLFEIRPNLIFDISGGLGISRQVIGQWQFQIGCTFTFISLLN